MPTPLVANKTWQARNVSTAATTTLQQAQLFLWNIKDFLKSAASNPWTVVGSTTGTGTAALDGVDRITGSTDFNWASGDGSAHSWIVLKNTQISANFQLLIDYVGGLNYRAKFIVSPSAGFTGGSLTTRPFATDEVIHTPDVATSTASITQNLFLTYSTDGKEVRAFNYRLATTSTTACLVIGCAKSPAPSWTTPWFIFTNRNGAVVSTNINESSSTGVQVSTTHGGRTIALGLLWSDFTCATTDAGQRILISSDDPKLGGHLGIIEDLYLSRGGIATSPIMGDETSARAWVLLHYQIFLAWDKTTAVSHDDSASSWQANANHYNWELDPFYVDSPAGNMLSDDVVSTDPNVGLSPTLVRTRTSDAFSLVHGFPEAEGIVSGASTFGWS